MKRVSVIIRLRRDGKLDVTMAKWEYGTLIDRIKYSGVSELSIRGELGRGDVHEDTPQV